MLVFRVLAFLWPFLKEMFLGPMSLMEALKKHKGRVFIIAVICLSIVVNFFAIPRLFQISAEHVLLKKKYIELRREIDGKLPEEPPVEPLKPNPVVESVSSEKAAPTVAPQPPPVRKTSATNVARYKKTKETFARIREREEKEANTAYH